MSDQRFGVVFSWIPYVVDPRHLSVGLLLPASDSISSVRWIRCSDRLAIVSQIMAASGRAVRSNSKTTGMNADIEVRYHLPPSSVCLSLLIGLKTPSYLLTLLCLTSTESIENVVWEYWHGRYNTLSVVSK